MDNLDTVFRSYIGRVVAFALAPVLAVAAGPVVKGVNDVLGTGYTEQQLSNIAIGAGVGIALVVWQWLRNRGNWEAKIAELEAIYRAGADVVELERQPGDGPALGAELGSAGEGRKPPAA